MAQTTPRTILEQTVASILSSLGLPDMFAPMAVNWLTGQFPGLSKTDAFWNSTLVSQAIRFGDVRENYRRAAQLMGTSIMQPMLDSSKQQFMLDAARTLIPRESYNPAEHGNMSWEDYTAMKGQGYSGNLLWNGMYSTFDPGKYIQTASNLGQAFSNMTARPAAYGDYGVYAKASGVLKRLFTDEKGAFSYDGAEYGGFDSAAAAYMASELTRSTDFLKDADASKAGTLKNAAERMRSRVKDLSRALSPLKDIFGNDIPKMIEDIEALTGQSIGNISSSRLRNISEKLASRYASGVYDLTDVATNKMQFEQMGMAMGIQTTSRLNYDGQAITALDWAKGGTQANFVTRTEQDQHVTKRVFGAQNSGQADALNKIYSIWNAQRGGKGSFEEFRKELRKMDPSETNPMAAGMRMVGARTQSDLDVGIGYTGYMQAVEAGLGGDIAMDRNMAIKRSNTINGLVSNMQLRQMTGTVGTSNRNVGQMLTDALKEVVTNPDVANMDVDARAKYLEGTGRMGADQALQLSKSIEFMRIKTPEVVLDAMGRADMEKQRKADANAKAMRSAIEQMTTDAPGDFGSALTKYIQKGGSISQMLSDGKLAQLAASAGSDKEGFTAVSTAMFNEAGQNAARRIQEYRSSLKPNDLNDPTKQAEIASQEAEIRKQEIRKAQEKTNYTLTDASALSNETVSAAKKELVDARSKGANSSVQERRLASAVDLAKGMNESMLSNALKPGNKNANKAFAELARETLGDGATEYGKGVMSLLDGKSFSKLTEEQQKALLAGGYSADPKAAEDNLRRAKLDVVGTSRDATGNLNAVTDAMVAANMETAIDNTTGTSTGDKKHLSAGMRMYREWAKSEGKGMTSASFNEWLETSAGQSYSGQREQLTAVFNQGMQASGINAKGETDIGGILGTISGLLRSIVDNTGKTAGNTEPNNDQDADPKKTK